MGNILTCVDEHRKRIGTGIERQIFVRDVKKKMLNAIQ